jgi:hypothetical protein
LQKKIDKNVEFYLFAEENRYFFFRILSICRRKEIKFLEFYVFAEENR